MTERATARLRWRRRCARCRESGSPNAAPAFPDPDDPDTEAVETSAARMVLENAEAGTNVGAPVRAADANNDILTYALTGDAATRFKIDPATGQITVRADSMLDAETEESAIVGEVLAVDPAGLFHSVDVEHHCRERCGRAADDNRHRGRR